MEEISVGNAMGEDMSVSKSTEANIFFLKIKYESRIIATHIINVVLALEMDGSNAKHALA